MLLSHMLSAKQVTYVVEEVELESTMLQYISAFVEQESASGFYHNGYPKENILSLFRCRPLREYEDREKLIPVVEFYPDLIQCHESEQIKYVSYIHIGDSTYNVYVIIHKEDELFWIKQREFLPIKTTGRYVSIIRKWDDPCGEYDPPFLRLWYIGNNNEDRNEVYVEWSLSN